jgi:hypothetical protein
LPFDVRVLRGVDSNAQTLAGLRADILPPGTAEHPGLYARRSNATPDSQVLRCFAPQPENAWPMMRKNFIMPGSRFIAWAVCDISSNSKWLPPTAAIELPTVGGSKGHGYVGSLEVVRPLAVDELEHLGDTTSIRQ